MTTLALAMLSTQDGLYPELHKKTEVRGRTNRSESERMRSKGLSEFCYANGNCLWALNQRSADKKARKKGWIG